MTDETTKTNKPAAVAEKALVSVPAPDIARRQFTVVSSDGHDPLAPAIAGARLQQYAIYYGMYRQHPIVRAAIDKVAKSAVSNGYVFQSEDPEKQPPKRKSQTLKTFFRRSNAVQLLRVTIKDLFIYGESFWWIEKTRGGQPFRAKRLHPAHIEVTLTPDGTEVAEYKYGSNWQEKGKVRKYKPTEILHFKFDDPDDDTRGLSLLASLQSTVATDLFAINYNGRFFENSAQTGVIFNMKNANQDEIDRNREYLQTEYVGAENAHKPLILEGDIDVQKSVSSAKDMEFVMGRKLNREDILAVLDVAPTKLGIMDNANRSSGKESDNSFREETIGSLFMVLEESINNALVLELFGWEDVVFALRKSSMRDLLEELKLWKEGEMAGVIDINHIRNEMGLPPVKGGDQHFVQTAAGLIPLLWIDDVAQRLIGQGDATIKPPAMDGTNQPTPEANPDDAPDGTDDPKEDPRDQADVAQDS